MKAIFLQVIWALLNTSLSCRFFEHISELDLSSQKIRDFSNCLTGDHFPNLRVLNLDNNMVSDLSNMLGLTALAVLRLNHNRVEHLVAEKLRNASEALPPTGLMTLTALEVLQACVPSLDYVEMLQLWPHVQEWWLSQPRWFFQLYANMRVHTS